MTDYTFSEEFRPKKLNQLIGKRQKEVAASLLERVQTSDFPREMLFAGPSGVGKTTIVLMLMRAITKEDTPEYNMLNCGANTGIDEIRNFIRLMRFFPMGAEYSLFYFDEIHGLSKDAQRALLTEIEPVPEHVIIFASTTEPDSLRKELRDRFTVFDLPSPDEAEMKMKAGWIINAHNKKVASDLQKKLEADLLDQIIASTGGSVRVLDKTLQEFIKGSYKPAVAEDQNPTSLVNMLFFQSISLQQLFQAAASETEYNGAAVGICNYAIKILSNPKSNPSSFTRAQVVLNYLGEGLSRNTSAKVSFYQKLLLIYAELVGK